MNVRHRHAKHRRMTAASSQRSCPNDGLTFKLGWLYFASGVPALVYQTVWQRLLVLHSGVGTISVAIIVAAYMLGIGLGSLCGARVSRRIRPAAALVGFAAIETTIALCAIASPTVLYDGLYLQGGWLYRELWHVVLLHIAVFLIPTGLMGATLPLMTRALVRESRSAPRSIGILYGLNTLGAAFGAVLAPWFLLPYAGVSGSIVVGALCNLGVATGALWTRFRSPAFADEVVPDAAHDAAEGPQPVVISSPPLWLWTVLYFLSGWYAIGLEILWFRIIDVGVKSTSFTFGTVLAIYLSCMALGSMAAAPRVVRIVEPLRVFLSCQCLILVSAAIALLAIVKCPETGFAVRWFVRYWGSYEPIHPSWDEFPAVALLYCAFPIFLMGLPTFLMGYSFTAMQRGVQRDVATSGYRVGLLQAANIAGCTLGSLLVGLWLLSALGSLGTLRLIVSSGTVFAMIGIVATSSRRSFAVGLAALAAAAWLLPDDRHLWLRMHGQRADGAALIAEDVTAVCALTPEPGQDRWRLSANGKGQGAIPFGGVHSKLGVLPAALHPAPKSVAIIGLGSGGTPWAASRRVETERVRVFEICASELPLLRQLAASQNLPNLQQFVRDPRIVVDSRDGRHALMTDPTTYDLIEADAIRPNGAYSGYLYSIEFFRLCGQRLNRGGLMCSWSPTPRTYATFRCAFPHVLELDGGTILIGSHQPIDFDASRWRARIQSVPVADALGRCVLQECLGATERARILPRSSDIPEAWTNTDLFPYDEFHPFLTNSAAR